jgi:hypothetical protein
MKVRNLIAREVGTGEGTRGWLYPTPFDREVEQLQLKAPTSQADNGEALAPSVSASLLLSLNASLPSYQD